MVMQVLQRGLPRPLSLDYAPEARSAEGLSQKEAAEALLFAEMRALLQHDAAKYPVKETKKDKKVSRLQGQPRTSVYHHQWAGFITVLCPISCFMIIWKGTASIAEFTLLHVAPQVWGGDESVVMFGCAAFI